MIGQNLIEIKEAYNENYQWLARIANIADDNRFFEIKSKINQLADSYDGKSNAVTREVSEKEIFLTSFEAKRFNDVVNFLKSLNDSHLPKRKIRSMCRGPIFHIDENQQSGDTEGRDIQFEFILSSFLRKAGIEVVDFDDIKIRYADTLVRFECKRPASERNPKNKFDLAVGQLVNKINNNSNEYGVVALSIEKFSGNHLNFFRGNDMNEVMERLIKIKNDTISMLKNNLQLPSDKKIIGLHLCINTFLWDKQAGTFYDVFTQFTERTVQEKPTPLYDFLFESIEGKLKSISNY